MSIVNDQWQFLIDIANLINFAAKNNFILTGGELYRTEEQQKIYVSTGKSKTMDSNHLKRLAIDFNVFFKGELTYDWETIKVLGDYWESLSPQNRWGGDFNKNEKKDGFIDSPHFERQLI